MRRIFFAFIPILLFRVDVSARDLIHVTIQKDAVELLRGWPLERRWYAVAVQSLVAAGARRIFIDIAFPFADVGHPESDEFFYYALTKHDNVFLLASEEGLRADSVVVMGNYKLPASRFFTTFSSNFQLRHGMLWLKTNESLSLVSALLDQSILPSSVLMALPETDAAADYSLLQVVQSPIPCRDLDVVISIDYPGVTSYVLTQTSSRLFSTTELQLHAVEKLYAGAYLKKWPGWVIGAAMSLGLSPLLLSFFSRMRISFGVLSLVICGLVFGGMKFLNVYVAPYWYSIFLLPLSLVAHGYFSQVVERRSQRSASRSEILPQPSASQLPTADIDEFQYKLKFYEHLQNQIPPEEIKELCEKSGLLYHQDSPLRQLLQKAKKISETDVPVMLFGESGTGKEMLARFIHECSSRSAQPFVAVNCGSFNENLIESELFGHEAGAFTGAQKRKMGRFELANGGSLFLDEIGETSPAVQVKLLRVLQEESFERVGGIESVRVSVRIITATHQNLQSAIRHKHFREDLFYRLNGISLVIPPLRERASDIEHLFKVFLFVRNPDIKISPSIVDWLKIQPWPGNVRELKTATERAIINAQLQNRKFLLPADFELQNARGAPQKDEEALSEQILSRLRQHQFKHRSISAVASELAIHRATVTEYLRGWIIRFMLEHDVDPSQICRALNGNPIVLNGKQLEERVQNYIQSIRDKISEGLGRRESDSEIRLGRFKNLPSEFDDDLAQLIQRLRK
ncbi:MAG TPA: sigma 54-interacting transcriptional regulator [bacterium]